MDEVMNGTRPRERLPAALRLLLWALGALAMLLIGVVFWVNRADEAPSADARALEAIVASARPVSAADDAIAGLAALGTLRVEATAPSDANGKVAAAASDEAAMRTSRGTRLHAAFNVCTPRRDDCPSLVAAAEPDMPAWIARNSALLAGYRRVLSRRGWYEAPPPENFDAWSPPGVGTAMEGQRLLLSQAMLDARAGRADAVRDALQADAAFWRAGLAGTRTLIGKMTAARAVQRNLDMGAWAIARLPAERVADAIPVAWNAPFTPAERSLLPALAWEWKSSDNHMHRLYRDARDGLHERDAPAINPLFKPQATSNRHARALRRIAQANGTEHAQLERAMRRLRAEIEDETRYPYSLYNPIGRILGSIALPAYGDYGGRVADLEARRRAVLAVADLHRNGIARAHVQSALNASTYRNPYDGRPFVWDAGPGCVRIGGIDRIEGRSCIAYAAIPVSTSG